MNICKTGKSQSPIDLSITPLNMSVGLMKIQYDNIAGTVLWDKTLNAFAINLPNQDKSKYKVNMVRRTASGQVFQKSFSLQRVVIRITSEHKKNNKNYPMEIQFIHHKDQGVPGWYSRLGFSFFVEPTEDEKDVSPLLKEFVPGTDVQMNGFSVLNSTPYFYYLGSLPFFPCTQDVNWFVFDTVMKIENSVYESMKEIIKKETGKETNNRPAQNIAGRKLYKFGKY
jgi:carbonic anhydrase